MYNLQGKVAIVTGAGGKLGLGRGIATRLAKEGADVAVVDRYAVVSEDVASKEGWRGIESVAEEIRALGRRAMTVVCDISKSDEVDAMVQKVVSGLGSVDILVNNAGIHMYAMIVEMSDDVWEKHLAVNLTGTFFCSRAAAREMVKRGKGGRIINISSVMGKSGMPDGQSAYVTSKFGIIGLTQCLALELASNKILVNAICPTLTSTSLHYDAFSEQAVGKDTTADEIRTKMNEALAARVPLGRIGVPADIANMAAFLASEEASFITGQSINVNGGLFTAM